MRRIREELLQYMTAAIGTFAGAALLLTGVAAAQEAEQGNASNPLAAVNNVDLRWKYTSADTGGTHDIFIAGSYMVQPKLKLQYELHYKFTDITGSDENEFEKLVIRPIYFPFQKKLNETWGLRAAVGIDLIVDFGHQDKGIGVDADQFAPLFAIAFSNFSSGLVLIPLVQQFVSFNGNTDVNMTAARLIALQPFGKGYWAKLDAIVPYDWENELWPVSSEIQVGYNFGPRWAIYADGLVGVGSDRLFDAGLGLGLRFKF